MGWRFFGHELYGEREDVFVGQKSGFTAKEKAVQSRHGNFGKKLVRALCLKLAGRKTDWNLFYQAIRRIDYMLVLCREEYDLLCTYWPNLPDFIQLPFFSAGSSAPPRFNLKQSERPKIVLGNSKSVFNNHLELIDLIDKVDFLHEYEFLLLFNYGNDNEYTNRIERLLEGRDQFNIISNFMQKEEFWDFYESISALVINGYRQMAVTNIMLAIQNGAKVYLNEKNVFLSFLRKKGFVVFSIDDFKNDLRTNSVSLDSSTAIHNYKQINLLKEKYSIKSFQQSIYLKLSQSNRHLASS